MSAPRMRVVASGSVLVQATLEENLERIADLGFRALDILLVSGWAHVGLDELAADFIGVMHRLERGLSISGLEVAAVNAKFSVALENEKATEQRQRELDAMLGLMDALGVNRVSIQPTLTGDRDYLARTFTASNAEARRMQEYAAERDIFMSLEPHILSAVCTNKGIARALREQPGLCFTADPSHLLYSGERMSSLRYLFEQASMVHLRDAREGALFVPYGQGNLDLDLAITTLNNAGYDCPIALEYLADNWDEDVYADLQAFRQAVEARVAKL